METKNVMKILILYKVLTVLSINEKLNFNYTKISSIRQSIHFYMILSFSRCAFLTNVMTKLFAKLILKKLLCNLHSKRSLVPRSITWRWATAMLGMYVDGNNCGCREGCRFTDGIVTWEIRRKDAITNRIINELFTGMYVTYPLR